MRADRVDIGLRCGRDCRTPGQKTCDDRGIHDVGDGDCVAEQIRAGGCRKVALRRPRLPRSVRCRPECPGSGPDRKSHGPNSSTCSAGGRESRNAFRPRSTGIGARDTIRRPERRFDSAQYSQTARDSQTRAPRCSRYGTSPFGDVFAISGVGPGRTNRATSIATSSPAMRTASQPRNDQEEYRRWPISSLPSDIFSRIRSPVTMRARSWRGRGLGLPVTRTRRSGNGDPGSGTGMFDEVRRTSKGGPRGRNAGGGRCSCSPSGSSCG